MHERPVSIGLPERTTNVGLNIGAGLWFLTFGSGVLWKRSSVTKLSSMRYSNIAKLMLGSAQSTQRRCPRRRNRLRRCFPPTVTTVLSVRHLLDVFGDVSGQFRVNCSDALEHCRHVNGKHSSDAQNVRSSSKIEGGSR